MKQTKNLVKNAVLVATVIYAVDGLVELGKDAVRFATNRKK